MPKSRKSSKKNGKPTDKPENQWVHVDDTPQPDTWEIVEEAGPQEDAGKLSDDDLIVILEDSCQHSLDLSLASGKTPQESPKDAPKKESTSTTESPVTSHEESPESELDKSSDFQIIDHSEEESSNETDLILENEILEAAKRNVSLKYSHIVRQSPQSETPTELTPQATPEGKTYPDGHESTSTEEFLKQGNPTAVGKQPIMGAMATGAKPKTEKEAPVTKSDEVGSDSGPEVEMARSGAEIAAPETDESNPLKGFVEKKSKKQKKKEKKRQAAVEVTEDVRELTAEAEEQLDPEDQQKTPEPEQDTAAVQKEYFETYSKNKKQRDLATMSILLAKDQTIEDLQEEEDVADTEEPKRCLEVVRESSIPEETESVSGGSEETASVAGGSEETTSVAGTEESSDRAETEVDGGRDNEDQNDPSVPKKVSKSARRRKKLKEKMAKVIENFSNPGLVMEKYEKTFGEDYVPPSNVVEATVDSSICCPVCLELYYHPYRVEPCGHVFCEPCLRKLTTRTCLDIPCPLCRNIIQSCHVDEELAQHITKSFPVKTAARNRAERKSKTKKNPLPRSDVEPGRPVSMKDIQARGCKGQEVRFSRTTIQRFLLVLIGLISYIFTLCTIRAITYFDFNSNNSTSYIFMTLIFCLYFYFVDMGVQKLKYLVQS